MSVTAQGSGVGSLLPAAAVATSVGVLAVGVATGVSTRATVGLVVLTTLAALAPRGLLAWPRLLGALILIILFVPIRRYALPGALPFQLELYRIFVAVLVLGWLASLLVDPRTRIRRTGFEGPLAVIVAAALASILVHPSRVAASSSEVDKKLMYLMSFVLVLYVTTSVIRRLDNVEYLAKTLVAGGAVVAFFALVEARTGYNVFNHLSRVMPFLRDLGDVGGFQRVGTDKLRVFASAQHPIALGAALVMLTPVAVYLARRYRQRRWTLCALLLVAALASTVSRTGIIMLAVAGLVFLWLRPRETRRLWPALLLLPIVIHFALPGTLGAIKNSFLPTGGLVAEQHASAGHGGSGRLADLGPALTVWQNDPLFGQGFGTKLILAPGGGDPNNVLDDQWLGTLLEVGLVGALGWLWFFVRAIRRFAAEAKRDHSERGWLLTSLTAGVTAYGVGMLTYDAFAFIQVSFLLFISIGLGSALLAERPTPLAVRMKRDERQLAPTDLAPDSSPA